MIKVIYSCQKIFFVFAVEGVIGRNVQRVSGLFEFVCEHHRTKRRIFHLIFQKLPEPVPVVDALPEIWNIAIVNDLFAVEKPGYAQGITGIEENIETRLMVVQSVVRVRFTCWKMTVPSSYVRVENSFLFSVGAYSQPVKRHWLFSFFN